MLRQFRCGNSNAWPNISRAANMTSHTSPTRIPDPGRNHLTVMRLVIDNWTVALVSFFRTSNDIDPEIFVFS